MKKNTNKKRVMGSPRLGLSDKLKGFFIPDHIINARNRIVEETEREHRPIVHLFFSFDIVNSTLYKTMTSKWPIIIRGLLEDIRARILKMPELVSCFLWRVIGDEMVFVLPVYSSKELPTSIDAIFEVAQRISVALKSGRFFDSLEDQGLQYSEIDVLKTQNMLSIKTAAWIAVLNNKLESPHDNISFYYTTISHNPIIREFLGKDIDAGFRLKKYTQDRRLVISVELAYFLIKFNKARYLHIIDYVRLKGVWNNALYPIIWYYNPKIIRICHKEMGEKAFSVSFDSSFRYDEADNNPLVKKYFLRKKSNSKMLIDEDVEMSIEMYDITSALDKIILDKNLISKIQYMESLLNENVFIATASCYMYPLATFDDNFRHGEINNTSILKKYFSRKKKDKNEMAVDEEIEFPPVVYDAQHPKTLSTRNLISKYIDSFFASFYSCVVICCNVELRTILIIRRTNESGSHPNKWEFGCVNTINNTPLIQSIVDYYKKSFDIEIKLILDESRDKCQPLPIAIYEINTSDTIEKRIFFVAKYIRPTTPGAPLPEGSCNEVKWISQNELKDFSKEDVVPYFHPTLETVFCNFDKYFK